MKIEDLKGTEAFPSVWRSGLGMITDTVSIRERPSSVEDRAVPGHWEGDLIFGSKNSQVATLVERQTRYVMLAKVGGKDTETVINATVRWHGIRGNGFDLRCALNVNSSNNH